MSFDWRSLLGQNPEEIDPTPDFMAAFADALHGFSAAYYAGTPVMLDSEYDRLYDIFTRWGAPAAGEIGAPAAGGFVRHAHLARRWSMDKATTRGEVRDWMAKAERAAGGPTVFAVEYKLDGLALNLTYREGRLIQAATRGDGRVGEAILEQVRTIASIPQDIAYRGLIEIQGEGFMRRSVLAEYNETAAEPLRNPRNAAAGALRNLDPLVTASRRLDAFFYDVGYIEDPPYTDQFGMLAFLREQGLPVSPFSERCARAEDVFCLLDEIEEARGTLDFDIDGAVLKAADFALRGAMGVTDRAPRWALAYKFPPEEVSTILREITWEVGRTGKLTPLAHLEPVEIAGATVRRATLNNPGDVVRKGVRVGDRVWVRRAGDVIPEIIGVAPDQEERNGALVEPPKVCPACGTPVVETGANIFCPSPECRPKVLAALDHYASRTAMDIRALSIKTLETLFDIGLVRDPADLYSLTADQIEGLPGIARRKAEILVEAIDGSRRAPLDRLIVALGIPTVGRATARDLAARYESLEALGTATAEELATIDEVGEIMAAAVVDWFAQEKNADILRRLREGGVDPRRREPARSGPEAVPGPLAGMTLVLTGTLPTLTREQAAEIIASAGGKMTGSVSKKTQYVLAGEDAGSKLEKARALGAEIVDEAWLMALCSR